MQQNPKYSKQKEKSFTSKEIHKNAVSLKMKYLIRNKIYLHTYELYIFMVAYSSYFLLSYFFNHFCFCIMNNPQWLKICFWFSKYRSTLFLIHLQYQEMQFTYLKSCYSIWKSRIRRSQGRWCGAPSK